MKTEQKIICGNNIETLKQFPDNYFDSIVTDPPYGYKFMGKKWDYEVPSVEFWEEAFRVLKYGGHLLSFCGTRTYHRMVVNIEDAGFEIRDCIQWIYGSGFPKSHNISKAIDKQFGVEREKEPNPLALKQTGQDAGKGLSGSKNSVKFIEPNPVTDEAKQWDGWGTALKPANEPICVARKPIEERLTIADNVMKHGTGAINIDGCRISHNEEQKITNRKDKGATWNIENCGFDNTKNSIASASALGRFPANVIFSHSPDCVCVGTKKVKGTCTGNAEKGENSNGAIESIRRGEFTDRTDENGLETVENWSCVDGCPIKELDKQSGITKSGKVKEDKSSYSGESNTKFLRGVSNSNNQHGDIGGASRFFYVAKPSKAERNKGLENFEDKKGSNLTNTSGRDIGAKLFCQICNKRQGACLCESPEFTHDNQSTRKNNHPTVKPVKLIQYLIRLITPPNGIVLDPFNGSGTTGIACKAEGFNYVGLELDSEYCKISEARIKGWDVNEKDIHCFTDVGEQKSEVINESVDNQLNLF